MTTAESNPEALDDMALLAYIRAVQGLANRGLQTAEVLQRRAHSAVNDYGARSGYAQHMQRCAAMAAAGAEMLAETLNRLLHEKNKRIQQLLHPRNGNVRHEIAADLQSALNDHNTIIREKR